MDMVSPLILVNLKTYHEGMAPKRSPDRRCGRDRGERERGCHRHRAGLHRDPPDEPALCNTGLCPGISTRSLPAPIPAIFCLKRSGRRGAHGTLINHSERRLTLADIDACVQASRRLRLESVVCTNNDSTSAAAAALRARLRGDRAPGADREWGLGLEGRPRDHRALRQRSQGREPGRESPDRGGDPVR